MQLTNAEETVTACSARSLNQQSENGQLLTQVQQLQNQVTDLKAKQQQVGLADSRGVGVNQRVQTSEHGIADDPKQSVYSDLQSKLKRGVKLTEHEEIMHQFLSKNKVPEQHIPLPGHPEAKVQAQAKQTYGNQPLPNHAALNHQVSLEGERQLVAAPLPNADVDNLKGVGEKDSEQEEIKDLLVNEDHVPEGNDKDNDFEGGADEDQNQDNIPDEDSPADGVIREGDVNEHDNPLPDPVDANGHNGEDFDGDVSAMTYLMWVMLWGQ